jgi:hypothetical protein
MTPQRKTWVYSPRKPAKPKLPEGVKAETERQAQELIDNVLKLKHIAPPPADAQFNYIVDIYGRWYRNYFYFCAKYASPGPSALSPDFESKFARLEYMGGQGDQSRFQLAFMRYTGAWVEVYTGLSLQECLASIRDDPFFHP